MRSLHALVLAALLSAIGLSFQLPPLPNDPPNTVIPCGTWWPTFTDFVIDDIKPNPFIECGTTLEEVIEDYQSFLFQACWFNADVECAGCSGTGCYRQLDMFGEDWTYTPQYDRDGCLVLVSFHLDVEQIAFGCSLCKLN